MSASPKTKVPVVVVFTQMDRLKKSEEYRSEVERYLDVKASSIQSNRLDDLSTLSTSLQPPLPVPVASLQGAGDQSFREHAREQGTNSSRERGSDQERDPCHLLALSNVTQLFFVSGSTGENVGGVRKYLFKMAIKLAEPDMAPGLQLIGRDVPLVYSRMEQLIKEFRVKSRAGRWNGEEGGRAKGKPFVTFWEAKRLLQPHLNDANLTESDFKCAFKFLHEVSALYSTCDCVPYWSLLHMYTCTCN